MRKASHNPWSRSLVEAALLGAALSVCGVACSKPPAAEERGRKGPADVPVEVLRLVPRDVEYAVSAVGSVEAFESVQITARVAGVLERVHFKQGDTVKKGALLAEIEPRRFELAHASAKAALDRVLAAKNEADRELERAQKLLAEGVATGLDVSQWQTRLATAAAEESQARAALGLASLNLQEARLRAPLTGVIQTRTVQTGQYVQEGTVLATLLQRDPLLLRFNVTEEESLRLRPGMTAHFKVKGSSDSHSAKITFVAGAADPTSRMVPVAAEVAEAPPAEGAAVAASSLRPGSFAEVSVPIDVVKNAIVAPDSAVRPSERGFLAFVVKDGAAEERVLSLGMRTRGGLVEVKQGLEQGEEVVVRGAEALRQGAKVRVQPSKAPPATSGQEGPATP